MQRNRDRFSLCLYAYKNFFDTSSWAVEEKEMFAFPFKGVSVALQESKRSVRSTRFCRALSH